MNLSTLKAQPDGIKVREILLKSSWSTHLKYSNPYIFIYKKVNNPPYIFCTHLFFVSATIHRIFRIIKVNLN